MKTHAHSLGACAALLLTLFGAAGNASATEYFGQRGQFVLGGESSVNALQWDHLRGEDKQPNVNNISFGIGPKFGVFVGRNVLLGLDLEAGAFLPGKDPQEAAENIKDLPQQSRNVFNVAAMPRIGYNVDFGAGVSLLPSIGVGYRFLREGPNNGHQVEAEVRLPLVFQIARHGALVAGPTGRYASDGSKITSFLPAKFTVGASGGLLIWI